MERFEFKKDKCAGFQVSRYEVYESVKGGNTVTSELRIYNVSREGEKLRNVNNARVSARPRIP
jgi:hypothetical protein